MNEFQPVAILVDDFPKISLSLLGADVEPQGLNGGLIFVTFVIYAQHLKASAVEGEGQIGAAAENFNCHGRQHWRHIICLGALGVTG